ncbi:hypothetical protein trd_A0571 (plasmid) [Thermomicrobium roseum DSM 5159]|uniref:Uncharacterized protein n=1 Tax=Thermomicrobium roseum (strain ATCC 27502 / DSM 5159 / P-2) TaxID=309801 RepID=B9L457_THERP|nr:hypothetical protein trd_A0571 [Thermomicrobium roseum DSM 5159]
MIIEDLRLHAVYHAPVPSPLSYPYPERSGTIGTVPGHLGGRRRCRLSIGFVSA